MSNSSKFFGTCLCLLGVGLGVGFYAGRESREEELATRKDESTFYHWKSLAQEATLETAVTGMPCTNDTMTTLGNFLAADSFNKWIFRGPNAEDYAVALASVYATQRALQTIFKTGSRSTTNSIAR